MALCLWVHLQEADPKGVFTRYGSAADFLQRVYRIKSAQVDVDVAADFTPQ